MKNKRKSSSPNANNGTRQHTKDDRNTSSDQTGSTDKEWHLSTKDKKNERKSKKPKKKQGKKLSLTPSPKIRKQLEAFDSHIYDDATSEMKEASTNEEPNNAKKPLSDMEDKRPINSKTISIKSRNVKTDAENTVNVNTKIRYPSVGTTLEKRDSAARESEEEEQRIQQQGQPQQHATKNDAAEVEKESEELSYIGEEVIRIYDKEEKKEHRFVHLANDSLFISMLKLWQDYAMAMIEVYNELMESCIDLIKSWTHFLHLSNENRKIT